MENNEKAYYEKVDIDHRIRSVCHIHPGAGHILLFRQARYPVYKRTAW